MTTPTTYFYTESANIPTSIILKERYGISQAQANDLRDYLTRQGVTPGQIRSLNIPEEALPPEYRGTEQNTQKLQVLLEAQAGGRAVPIPQGPGQLVNKSTYTQVEALRAKTLQERQKEAAFLEAQKNPYVTVDSNAVEEFNRSMAGAGINNAQDFFNAVKSGRLSTDEKGNIIITEKARVTVPVKDQASLLYPVAPAGAAPGDTTLPPNPVYDVTKFDINKPPVPPNRTNFTPGGSINANSPAYKNAVAYQDRRNPFDIASEKAEIAAKSSDFLIIPGVLNTAFQGLVGAERGVRGLLPKKISNPLDVAKVVYTAPTAIATGIWEGVKNPDLFAAPVVEAIDYTFTGNFPGAAEKLGEISAGVLVFENLKIPFKGAIKGTVRAATDILPDNIKVLEAAQADAGYKFFTQSYTPEGRQGVLLPNIRAQDVNTGAMGETANPFNLQPRNAEALTAENNYLKTLPSGERIYTGPSKGFNVELQAQLYPKPGVKLMENSFFSGEKVTPMSYFEFIKTAKPEQIEGIMQSQGQSSLYNYPGVEYPRPGETPFKSLTSQDVLKIFREDQAKGLTAEQKKLMVKTESGETVRFYSVEPISASYLAVYDYLSGKDIPGKLKNFLSSSEETPTPIRTNQPTIPAASLKYPRVMGTLPITSGPSSQELESIYSPNNVTFEFTRTTQINSLPRPVIGPGSAELETQKDKNDIFTTPRNFQSGKNKIFTGSPQVSELEQNNEAAVLPKLNIVQESNQAQYLETATVMKQAQKPGAIFTRLRTSPYNPREKPPEATTPFKPLIFPQTNKSVFGAPGFNVLVKKAGLWTKINPAPLVKGQALSFGAGAVDISPAASFKIEKARTPGTSIKGFTPGNIKNFYNKGGVYIEKNKFRINTPGELRGITFKGIQASKGKSKIKKLFGV